MRLFCWITGKFQTLIIPGFLISLLTFPGVIVHENAHLLFCRLFHVRVAKVCYFRLGNPAGYVVHETPRHAGQSLMISIGPLFVNTIVGLLVAFPASTPVLTHRAATRLDYILLWLGISIAMHSFPSFGDAKSLWAQLWRPGVSFGMRLLGMPIAGLICLGALGSVIWLDVIYGIAVAVILPRFLLALLV
jgi:hypothetical protein